MKAVILVQQNVLGFFVWRMRIYVSGSEYAEAVLIYYLYAATATLFFSRFRFFAKLDVCWQM